MPRRSLLTAKTRHQLFGIPEDSEQLTRFYTLTREDHDLIRTRRRDENRLGLAVHIALLRHPGQGWIDGTTIPELFVMWLAEQLAVSITDLTGYAQRRKINSDHHLLAMQHLALQPFRAEHSVMAARLASEAAFATDHGQDIMFTLCAGLREQRLVLPSTDTLERLALKGRAAARRQAAASIFESLSKGHRMALEMPVDQRSWYWTVAIDLAARPPALHKPSKHACAAGAHSISQRTGPAI